MILFGICWGWTCYGFVIDKDFGCPWSSCGSDLSFKLLFYRHAVNDKDTYKLKMSPLHLIHSIYENHFFLIEKIDPMVEDLQGYLGAKIGRENLKPAIPPWVRRKTRYIFNPSSSWAHHFKLYSQKNTNLSIHCFQCTYMQMLWECSENFWFNT